MNDYSNNKIKTQINKDTEIFYGFEKLSLVDYPKKICTTLFTSKCNFRCPFCHNSSLVVDYQDIENISFEDIMNYLRSRKRIIEAVCISGGEPTLNHNLAKSLREIKNEGFFIKLDTNGTNKQMLSDLISQKLVDYVAMDIKNSIEEYSKTIGIEKYDLNNILDSIAYLKEGHVEYEFRTTLVKEFHTTESIEKMGQMIKGADILYLQRFVDHNSCIQDSLHEVPLDIAILYQNILKKYVTKVELRGYPL